MIVNDSDNVLKFYIPVVHWPKRSPILFVHGRKLIKNTPSKLGMKKILLT